MREARGMLPGPLCACACSLFKNKKKYTQEGDNARGGPAGLLCASAWVGGEVRGGPPGLLCVSACACGLNINKKKIKSYFRKALK